MTINIEMTDAPDTAALAALHQSCFEKGWDEAAIGELLAIPGTLALVGGAYDGFLLIRCLAGEAEILTLAVHAAARRRGLARVLVRRGFAWAAKEGAQAVFLEVSESNVAARALYESFGLAISGRRKGYYRNLNGTCEDAVIMRAALPYPSL